MVLAAHIGKGAISCFFVSVCNSLKSMAHTRLTPFQTDLTGKETSNKRDCMKNHLSRDPVTQIDVQHLCLDDCYRSRDRRKVVARLKKTVIVSSRTHSSTSGN